MEKIRILHFVSSLSKSSGVMSVIMNYYRHIDRDKIQFDFVYFVDSDNTYEEEIRKYGGMTYLISKPSLKKSSKLDLIKILNNNKYIAIHNHVAFLTFFLAPLAKEYGIKNIIAHSHATMYSDKPLSAVRNRLLSFRLKKYATHYYACSKAAGEFLYGKKSMDAGNVVVINNAIDCERFKFNEVIRSNVRKMLELEQKVVIGHVGRFNEQKNHMFIIDVFEAIRKIESRAKLVLVGDGPLFETIREKIKQLDLCDDVLLLGNRNDVHELLQGMDVFLLPSLFEGLPMVAVEAQTTGLPIVLSTSITREIGLFNYKYLNIKQPLGSWAKEVLTIEKNNNRTQAFLHVKEKGFNIIQESKKLEKMYLEMK